MSEATVHKNGGRVAILFNDSLQCKISCSNLVSFEYVAPQLNSSSWAMFLNIYRPLEQCATFFDDIAELLSIICTGFDYDCQDGETKELCWVLNNYGLTQYVTEHNMGWTKVWTFLRLWWLMSLFLIIPVFFFDSTISVHIKVTWNI